MRERGREGERGRERERERGREGWRGGEGELAQIPVGEGIVPISIGSISALR